MTIPQIFDSIIEEFGDSDMAESEFQRLCADDETIRKEYKSWCSSRGLSVRNGFSAYFDEKMDRENSRWEALSENEDNYDF